MIPGNWLRDNEFMAPKTERKMGKITVKIEGSFGKADEKVFEAEHGGHAYALTRAIGMLFARMSPAIRIDHANHAEGVYPETPFGRKE